MRTTAIAILFVTLAVAGAADPDSADPPDGAATRLWYSGPAGNWPREALPIGNGRIGAMITGLRARGGYAADMEWKDGKLTRAQLHNVSGTGGACAVRYGSVTKTCEIPRGRSTVLTGRDFE